jgi:hypothetical protein
MEPDLFGYSDSEQQYVDKQRVEQQIVETLRASRVRALTEDEVHLVAWGVNAEVLRMVTP